MRPFARACALLVSSCLACGPSATKRADASVTCLMPTRDASVWRACAPDTALRLGADALDAGVIPPESASTRPDENRGDTTQADASAPDEREAGPVDAATLAQDAAAASDRSEDTHTAESASTGLPAEPVPSCPTPGACVDPEYPCVAADEDAGFTCRGQYAAWPMPDTEPSAKFAPAYTVMAADGVVFDQITGLLWQASLPDAYTGCTGLATSTPGGTCSWDEAVRYCEQLQLAQRRWRLPSLVELVSLLDHRNSAELVRPMLDEAAFPRPPEDIAFWTATTLGALRR